MWPPESITTDRLLIRAFHEDDRAAVIRLHTDAQVRRYLGGPRSRQAVEAALAAQPLGTTWGAFAVVDRVTDELVGSVSLSRERGELELSWLLLPDHWGRGFAEEAVRAVLLWAFAGCDDERIIAVTQSANSSSCRLAERLGMTREATFEEYGAEQVRFVLER
jgi:ribosomal-protein-alanine N-acetyltransferase